MAYFNYSGAESGDLSEVYTSAGTTLTVSSSGPKSGSYAYDFGTQDCYIRFGQLNANGTHEAFSKVIGTDVFSVGFWWKAANSGDLAAATFVLSIQDTSNANLCGLVYNTAGTLRLNSNANPGLGQTGATYTPTPGTWYYIEVTMDTLGGTNCNWYVNGSSITNPSLFSVNFGSTACWLQFGLTTGGTNAYSSGDPKWDDVYLADDSSSKYNSGNPIAVANSVPRAAGAAAQWTTGTSSLFSAVDEVPHNSDTDYIGDATNTDASSFAMQSVSTLGITGSTIAAVKTVAIVRDEGGASTIKVRLRNGSTNNDTSGVDPGSSYVALARIDATDPNTSAAWTTSGFDTIEGGVVNGASVAARCTAIYAMVLYTPIVLGAIFPTRQSVAVQRAAYW